MTWKFVCYVHGSFTEQASILDHTQTIPMFWKESVTLVLISLAHAYRPTASLERSISRGPKGKGMRATNEKANVRVIFEQKSKLHGIQSPLPNATLMLDESARITLFRDQCRPPHASIISALLRTASRLSLSFAGSRPAASITSTRCCSSTISTCPGLRGLMLVFWMMG